MKCSHCGYESQEDFIYCTNCGTAVADAPAISLNPAADKVLKALKDKLFLVICILMTAASALAVIGGSLPVLNILFTIFLWLTYSQAENGFADPNHLRRISGTVYANYVIGNVAAGIFIACGLMIGGAFRTVADNFGLIEEIEEALDDIDLPFNAFSFSENSFPIIGWVFAFAFILAGALVLVFNLLGMRKIHHFAKSVYQGILTQNVNFENPRAVKNWLIFFAVCSGLTALGAAAESPLSAVSNGCITAAEIISAIMINKYFLSAEN